MRRKILRADQNFRQMRGESGRGRDGGVKKTTPEAFLETGWGGDPTNHPLNIPNPHTHTARQLRNQTVSGGVCAASCSCQPKMNR